MATAPPSWREEWKRAPPSTSAVVTAKLPLPARPKTVSTPRRASVEPTTWAAVEVAMEATLRDTLRPYRRRRRRSLGGHGRAAPCSPLRRTPPTGRTRDAEPYHRPARRPRRRRRARGRPHPAAERAYAGHPAAGALRQHAAALPAPALPLRRRGAGVGVGRAGARRAHRHPPRRANPLDHRTGPRG